MGSEPMTFKSLPNALPTEPCGRFESSGENDACDLLNTSTQTQTTNIYSLDQLKLSPPPHA